MGNAHKTHDFPAKLSNNGNMTNDQTNIANMFNGFFTNVGPDLAKTSLLLVTQAFLITCRTGMKIVCS